MVEHSASASLPSGVSVERTDRGLRVTHRAFSLVTLLFSLAFLGLFLVLVIGGVLSSPAHCLFVPSLGLALLGGVGVYHSLLGRFVVEATTERLCVHAHHVPFAPKTRCTDADSIVAFHCAQTRVGGDFTDLCAQLSDGRTLKLIEAIHSREAAIYMRHVLARALHVREDTHLHTLHSDKSTPIHA